MVKMKYGRMLTIGLIPEELKMLEQGLPLHIDMRELGDKGHIILLVGDSNEKLKSMCEQTAAALEQSKRLKNSPLVLPPGVKL